MLTPLSFLNMVSNAANDNTWHILMAGSGITVAVKTIQTPNFHSKSSVLTILNGFCDTTADSLYTLMHTMNCNGYSFKT